MDTYQTAHNPESPTQSSPTSTNPYPRTYLPASCEPPSSSKPAEQTVWVIFGATGHLGRSICRVALARGDCVTAVGRNLPGEEAFMKGWHQMCQGLVCDVRVRDTISKVFSRALGHWGKIDVVVNCTGYGIIGACEDQDEREIRAQFETNLVGAANIFQLTLPYFRERGSGMYIVFSSTAGTLGIPGLGPYCATKWAIEGLAESLMYEVEPLGIKVTIVVPGLSRRDELAPMWGHFLLKPPADAYRATNSPAQHATRMIDWLKYREPTSAIRIAEITWELGHSTHPPLRLFMGNHAVEAIRDRLRSTIEEVSFPFLSFLMWWPLVGGWGYF
ncbi:NAD(P)-binding protein [Choiromyces venosus 120613-1]|uniref:NAD(P)-binding protein n=1 Tax=Choiromyces venosus 120613-1 TaxID=1336337 RepID=A0A3N4K5I3_9PEZI|nr:NAD(P)-binding protein [Choiromyces venosus 120613-1]